MCVNDHLVHFKARLQSEQSSTLVTTVALWQDRDVTMQHWIENQREMEVSWTVAIFTNHKKAAMHPNPNLNKSAF